MTSDRDDRMDAAVAEYLAACDAGNPPDPAAFLARYPDLADSLAAFLDDHRHMKRAADPDPTVTFSPGQDSPGTSRYVGDYELLAEIARGGMGVVYRARQVSVDRLVAVKMLLSGAGADEAESRRFKVETVAAATLDHPNILPIYEVGDHEGKPYFSMKLAEGGSLATHLDKFQGRPKETAALVAKLARAVQYAHQRGILHRDLKPGNILLDATGEPLVADFGLAKRVDTDAGVTRTGAVVGTPSYMPPEQARGAKGVSPAADIYSLGAILYACLTGRPPFREATVMETLLAVLEKEPVPPRSVNPGADPDLSVIALKCLNKEPEKRYASAAALADDLERWLRGEPIRARPVGRLEKVGKWMRRNPVVTGLLAVVVLVLVVGSALAALALALSSRVAVVQGEKRSEEEAKTKARQERDQKEVERQESVARELLKPLAQDLPLWEVPRGVSDAEVNALAAIRNAAPGVRDRLVEVAFRAPATAARFRYRAPYVLHAVVGLDPGLRAETEKVLLAQLEGPTALDAALTLSSLGRLDRATAVQAASVIFAGLDGQTDGNALMRLEHASYPLIDRLDAAEARSATGSLLQVMARHQRVQVYFLSYVVAALAARLDTKAAAEVSGKAAAAVLAVLPGEGREQFGRTVVLADNLSAGLANLTRRMEPKEAAEVCAKAAAHLVEIWTGQTSFGPPPVGQLGHSLNALVSLMEPRVASQLCGQALLKYFTALAKTTGRSPSWDEEKERRALLLLIERLQAADASKVVALLMEQGKSKGGQFATWNQHQHVMTMFLALTRRQEPKEAIDAVLFLMRNSANLELHPSLSECTAVLLEAARRCEPKVATERCREVLPLILQMQHWAHFREKPGQSDGRAVLAALAKYAGIQETADAIVAAAEKPMVNYRMIGQMETLALLAPSGQIPDQCARATRILLAYDWPDPRETDAGSLFTRPGPGANWDKQQARAYGLAFELARYLEPEVAAEVRGKVITAITAHVSARRQALQSGQGTPRGNVARIESLCQLARAAVTLAPSLDRKVAEELCGAVAADLVAFLPQAHRPEHLPQFAIQPRMPVDNIAPLAEAVAALAAHLEAKKASDVCEKAAPPVLDLLRPVDGTFDGRRLSRVLSALTERMDDRAATDLRGRVAALLLARFRDPRRRFDRNELFVWIRDLGKEGEPALAEAERLLEQEKESSPLVEPPPSVERLSPVEAAEAAHRFCAAMGTMQDPGVAVSLADNLSRCAARMEPVEASRVCRQAADTILARDGWDTLPARQAINRALGALELRLTEKDADEVQGRAALAVLVSMARHPDQAAQMAGLLTGHLIPVPANEFRQHLCAAVALGGQGQLFPTLTIVVPAAQYPRPLPPQMLADLLRHPLCLGPARTAVLEQLARHYHRPFADVWAFVEFAEAGNLGLGLRAPP
jgi:hypothetical protein